ncbi:MAG: hypothetical protein ACHQ53_17655 [Polyangiales bacterium]
MRLEPCVRWASTRALALCCLLGCTSTGVVGTSSAAKTRCDGGAADCPSSMQCVAGLCSQCSADTDCAHEQKGLCNGTVCVACRTANDCSAGSPLCVKNVCQECAEDLDCGHDTSCMDGVCRAEPGDHGGAGSGGT